MSQPITASDLLRRARQLLTPPGAWLQGNYHDEDYTRHCLLGSLAAANRELGADSHLYSEAARLVKAELPAQGAKDVESWNDHPERAQEDVLRLLDRAAGGK